MGYDSEMTTKGYQRINPTFKQKRIYVYLKDGVKISAFTKRMKQMYSDQIKDILNLRKLIDTMLGVYGSIIQILGIVIALITGCIVALVLYLITKAQIVSNRTSYGIQKAIGYTTKQIRLQLAMSYVPVLLIGSLLGAIASKVLTNPLISKLFQSFGVMRMEFNIPVAILLFLGILITLFGFMIAMLVSGRIKKISTIQLIRE